MATQDDYIPNEDGDFHEWQGIMDDTITANDVAWSLPAGKATEFHGKRVIYDGQYTAAHTPSTRNTGTIATHRDGRITHEKYIRGFVKSYLVGNTAVTVQQRKDLRIAALEITRSERPKITVAPNVSLKAMGNLEILIECRRPEDESRPSMHRHANLIEFRSKITSAGPADNGGGGPVPIPGDTPPANYAQAPDVSTSTKARFTHILEDPEASGKWLYIFARYKNTTDVTKSGPWSEMAHVRIS